MRSSTCGQMEVRRASPAADPLISSVDVPSSDRSATGTITSSSTVLLDGGCTTTTSRVPPRNRATSSTGRTVADRPIRRAGRSSRASRRSRDEREVGAALGAGDGVDLVDDDGLDAAQRLARLGGQQQEQRLGRGDEDVGGLARELAALVGGGVTGADGDAHVGRLEAEALGGLPDAGEGAAEVALDVDGEGLERGDVEDAAPVERVLGGRAGGDPVEGPEEGRQRLAGAGGGDDEGVLAGGGRAPGAFLGGGRSLERALEPRPGRRRQQPERRRLGGRAYGASAHPRPPRRHATART